MNKSIIEEYIGKVYVVVMLVVTGSCLCAGITLSALKLLGFYPAVSYIFVLVCGLLNILLESKTERKF